MCTCHTWTTIRHRWTHTHAHAIANSCCPSLEPHPFRSKELSTARGTPNESPCDHNGPRSFRPTLIRPFGPQREPSRPHRGSPHTSHQHDRGYLRCPSAAPRAGETRGKIEWRGTHARTRPEAPTAGQAASHTSSHTPRHATRYGLTCLGSRIALAVRVEVLEAAAGRGSQSSRFMPWSRLWSRCSRVKERTPAARGVHCPGHERFVSCTQTSIRR